MNILKQIIHNNIIPSIEWITSTSIIIKKIPRIKLHKKAVNDGRSMSLYVALVKQFCNYTPQNIYEIGANYGQDAEFLREKFCLKPSDIYAFEAHSQIYPEISKLYSFNVYNFAISNINGIAKFNEIDLAQSNTGISSLSKCLTINEDIFNPVEVEMKRMDSFISDNSIENIDFLKLDVEGMNYEVLEGFGEKISFVRAIQVEGEYSQYWEGQKLFTDISNLLVENDFKLIHFSLSADAVQSDSFWIQNQYLKKAIE